VTRLLFLAAGGAALTTYLLMRLLLTYLPAFRNRATRRWRAVLGVPSSVFETRVVDLWARIATGWRRRRERAEIDAGMEELIIELAFLLRAGFPLVSALRHAVRELTGPVGDRLGETMGLYDSGLPLERALRDFSDRVGTADATVVVNALLIGMRTGGDLPVMLTGCARVLRNRRLLRGELSSQTVEARWSAGVVAAAPLVLLAFFVVCQPGFLAPLMAAGWGPYAIAYAVCSWGLGVFCVFYLTRLEQVEPRGVSR